MKAFSLLSIGLITLSFTAQADRGEDHYKEMCLSPEIQRLVGTKGSCNIVTAPSPKVVKGVCTGILLKQIECRVSYDTTGTDSTVGMLVSCGPETSPILNQRLEISPSVYTVSAVIRTEDGQILIKKNPNTNAVIESGLVELVVSESSEGIKIGSMNFMLKDTVNPMTNVTCK